MTLKKELLARFESRAARVTDSSITIPVRALIKEIGASKSDVVRKLLIKKLKQYGFNSLSEAKRALGMTP